MDRFNLDALFKPRSIAIIGASVKELSIGNVITKNLLHYQFKGPVYPVNPKAEDIRGLKAYKSVLEIPGEVDLAHIVIPPPFVPDEVENCGKKGIKAIIINTAGFKEMGSEGQALENDFLARAKKYGIRIFGPNCQGTINSDPDFRAYCDFTFTFPEPGYISIVAQSGGVGAVIMQAFYDKGIGMRMYASNGNASDVSIPEIIKYYGDDPGTRAIVLYVESLENPAEFMEIAREVSSVKPILAMTAGRTDKGAEASRSHIGGLAGSISMDLIFRKTGILAFQNQEELCHAAVAFAYQKIPAGNKVGILTNTGGPSVIAIDELVSNGLEIPALSQKAVDSLKITQFESASLRNPLDIAATAGAPQFRNAMEVLMNEDQYDSIYINFVTPPFVDCESVAEVLSDFSLQKKKTIVCNYMTDKENWKGTTKILKKGEIPCYDFAETAAKALSAMVRYRRVLETNRGKIKTFSDVSKEKVSIILESAKQRNCSFLDAFDTYSILEAYKIPVAGWGVANHPDEVLLIANKIGYPIVVKADSEKIIHKSDSGAVAINLSNDQDVKNTLQKMNEKLGSGIRFFIQKYIPGGQELIVGAKAEPSVGHILMFGLGGVFVEVLKDVAFTLTPVGDKESMELINSIKSARLLYEFRGKKEVDIETVSDIFQRVSALVTDFPEIKELDLNPLMAFHDIVVAVDARILL